MRGVHGFASGSAEGAAAAVGVVLGPITRTGCRGASKGSEVLRDGEGCGRAEGWSCSFPTFSGELNGVGALAGATKGLAAAVARTRGGRLGPAGVRAVSALLGFASPGRRALFQIKMCLVMFENAGLDGFEDILGSAFS